MQAGASRCRPTCSKILDLAHATGRRLSAICGLWYSAYLPDAEDELGRRLPYGAIRWRGETDKQGREWIAPINEIAKAAIDRIRRLRPAVGDRYVFPDPRDPNKPIGRHRPDNWLRQAEKLADLEPQRGSL